MEPFCGQPFALAARRKPFVTASSCRRVSRRFKKPFQFKYFCGCPGALPAKNVNGLSSIAGIAQQPIGGQNVVAVSGAMVGTRAEPGSPMDDICAFTRRPLAFLAHYVKQRAAAHGLIFAAVLAAVTCSVGAQYGVKMLVDSLAGASVEIAAVWIAFATLASLIAADNLLWRLAMYVGSFTFTAVTGDIRRDLFRHLTGHAPSYFTDRLPGTLTSRITATSNAAFTVENMLVCNVLPPCVATLSAIILMVSVNLPMAGVLAIIAGIIVVAMFRIAAAGEPLHHQYAHHAASVDGEMIDVIGNMPIVLSFCGRRASPRRWPRF